MMMRAASRGASALTLTLALALALGLAAAQAPTIDADGAAPLSADAWTVFGKSTNPLLQWAPADAGVLGSYEHTHDADNWSRDLVPALTQLQSGGHYSVMV